MSLSVRHLRLLSKASAWMPLKNLTCRSCLFSTIGGEVDTTHPNYAANVNAMKKLTEQYRKLEALAHAGGGEKAIERHVKRNKKLLVTDRVKLLLDKDSKFLELSLLAGIGMEYGDVPRAGGLIGIGKVHGKYVMVIANDGSVKGGTVYPITLKKQLRAQEIAEQNRIPCVYIVDSGGAFLPLQSEIFPDKNQGGRTFYNEAIMSALKIPQIAIVCGNCTAGGAYIPTMADEAIIVHRIGTIFLGGPPLVKAATGEIVSTEDLGGATMHSSISGCTDYYAENEEAGFQLGRDVIEGLNLCEGSGPQREVEEPLYDPSELDGIIPCTDQHLMDIYKVIARIVDGSKFHEFKAMYGPTLVTGFSHIHGHLTGIVGNQGEITGEAAAKGAHFVQLCCERNIPIVFLQNSVPESQTSHSQYYGVTSGNNLRNHAKMMAAISCASVPKITVIVGNSHGSANYLMSGKAMSPNFIFTWPNAVVGLMETETLVDRICQEKYGTNIPQSEEINAAKAKLKERYSREMTAFYSSSRVLDDGLILPKDTREVLGQCLSITKAYVPQQSTQYSVMRM